MGGVVSHSSDTYAGGNSSNTDKNSLTSANLANDSNELREPKQFNKANKENGDQSLLNEATLNNAVSDQEPALVQSVDAAVRKEMSDSQVIPEIITEMSSSVASCSNKSCCSKCRAMGCQHHTCEVGEDITELVKDATGCANELHSILDDITESLGVTGNTDDIMRDHSTMVNTSTEKVDTINNCSTELEATKYNTSPVALISNATSVLGATMSEEANELERIQGKTTCSTITEADTCVLNSTNNLVNAEIFLPAECPASAHNLPGASSSTTQASGTSVEDSPANLPSNSGCGHSVIDRTQTPDQDQTPSSDEDVDHSSDECVVCQVS